jgi:Cu2+-containing amine oxidase
MDNIVCLYEKEARGRICIGWNHWNANCHHESGRYDKSFVVNAIINMDNTGFTLKHV